MWNAVKFALSALLVLASALVFILGVRSDPGVLILIPFFLLLAAMPWVFSPHAKRALGLMGIVMSIGGFFLAFTVFSGDQAFPQSCSGRRAAACSFLNYLHEVGGNALAGSFWVFMALVFLAMGVLVVLLEGSRTSRE